MFDDNEVFSQDDINIQRHEFINFTSDIFERMTSMTEIRNDTINDLINLPDEVTTNEEHERVTRELEDIENAMTITLFALNDIVVEIRLYKDVPEGFESLYGALLELGLSGYYCALNQQLVFDDAEHKPANEVSQAIEEKHDMNGILYLQELERITDYLSEE